MSGDAKRLADLVIRFEIEALNARFAYLIDHDRSDEVPALFTEDGVYGRSTGERSRGRAAIAESYSRRAGRGPRTARHIFTNLHLTIESGARARGTSILTLFAQDGHPPHPAEVLLVADYDDVYHRGDDGLWRYSERIVTWLFQKPGRSSALSFQTSVAS